MTILQQPEALSLSGNLAKFVISSPDDIAFTLKQGSDTIYIANYSPGKNNQIEIDVKDIIEANLKSVFRDSSSPYEQTALAKEFTAVIAGQQVKFTVVKGGVDRLATSANNFLSHNWLTWQPQTKQVTYSLPEMLTMYSTAASVVKVKAYFPLPDGTYEEQTAQLLSIVAGKAYTIPVGYAVIAKAFSSKLPAFYDVWFETLEGVRLSYIQRYVASSSRSENEQWVVFENSLGGFDTFRAYGDQSLEANHEHQLAEFSDETSEYRVDTSREYTQNTGYLTPQERKWMLDFLPSQQKYLFLGNYLRRIIVTEDRTSYVQQELPSSYQFTYKYADAKPYLNLQRTEELPPVLNIQIPDLESFTMPPRLVEFPAQSLSEGVLFPVQNPYSETWATTTIGEILRYVLKYIIDSDDGSSRGIGHHHSNYELLEALHSLEGYLTVHGQKIKAGYADIANDLTDKARSMFLRKDKEDQTEFLTSFLAGAEYGEFVDSMLAGRGAGILPDGRGQFERLEVRGSLSVLDLIINQIQGMESDYSFTEIGKIESVEDLGENTYRLTVEKRTEFDFMKFRENDVCFSIVNTLLTGGSEYYTSWMRVLATNVQDNSITVVLYPGSEVPGGTNYPPMAGYNVTRRGNSVIPDKGDTNERAQSWLMSSREGRMMFLANVYKPVLEDYSYALTIGKLPNLKALEKLPVTTKDVGIVAQTVIAEKFYQFDYNGDVVPNKVDRGAWSPDTARGGAPYRFMRHELQKPSGNEYTLLEQHTVYHSGCKWGCLKDKNTDEPKWNSPSWELLEGDSRYSLELSLSGGEAFVAGNVDTVISGRIFFGTADITDDVMAAGGTEVEWLRDSGNAPADNLWTAEYVHGSRLAVHVDNSNLHGVGSDFGFTSRSVSFICRVFIPVGGEIQRIEQKFGFDIL